METQLMQQHEKAYRLHALLVEIGFDALVELGGGGLLIVSAPIEPRRNGRQERILYAPYAEESLIIETLTNGECEEHFYSPRFDVEGDFSATELVIDLIKFEIRPLNESEIL